MEFCICLKIMLELFMDLQCSGLDEQVTKLKQDIVEKCTTMEKIEENASYTFERTRYQSLSQNPPENFSSCYMGLS
ncbi:hypothetical protein HanPI659440_Chr05g0206301 [Helianthus annuus]|nr:hypothetical protein HanPI659440_Chr05g0206301 [Helianthus annuus]